MVQGGTLRIWSAVAFRVFFAVAAFVVLAPVFPALAQLPGGGTIQEIRIEGEQRVEPETVRSYLLVQPGDSFDSDRIDKSLKALFATGLFADVSLRRDGNALIVQVVEDPVINRISFEGNHKLSDESLTQEIQLRPRIVYTREKVQGDVKRILDLYRHNGRFGATVEPKVIPLEQNRVDLVFEINEGPVTGVRSISFIGNHEFDSNRLREVLETKESRWYRFLSSSDTYDPDRLNYDRELLRKFYLAEGYADFRVASAVAELTPARDGFFITMAVEEGPRYRFGKINIVNQLKDVDPATLQALVTAREGDWYNADLIDKSVNALTEGLGNRGFAFVDIQPQVKRNADARTLDVTFNIKEGPRVYVERIDINGNVRTLDRVIRREFRLVEGDAFNTSKLDRSEQRIKNLGFFKKTEVTHTAGSAPDKTIVAVNLEEQSTGEFSVGVGFSTSQGPLADISVRERNLLGRGQDLRVETVIAQYTDQIDLSFTEPYFLERNLSAGIDLFAMNRNDQLYSGFNQLSVGATGRLGYQITESLRQTLSYTLREDSISNVNSGVTSIFVQEEAGARLSSVVGQSLLYDRRDNRLLPTSGFYMSLGTDFAGLGGDVKYVRANLSGGWYYSIAPSWVLGLTTESGGILGVFGDKVRIEDRFFVGGDNLRGFKNGGIGPRDLVTGDALGGNYYTVGSATLNVPLGLPKEFGLAGRIFTDMGTLWDVDSTTNKITLAAGQPPPILKDINSLRASSGVGVSWTSPMGPIRLDIGYPWMRQTFDKAEYFRISFGTKF